MSSLPNDQILREQYLDFLKNRKFRQTLLCHAGVPLIRTLKPEQVTVYYASSSVRPVSTRPDIYSWTKEEFRTAQGRTVETDHPLAKAALLRLGEVWPRVVRFDDLLALAQTQMQMGAKQEEEKRDSDSLVLGELLLKTYAANAVRLHLHAHNFVLKVSEHPVASRLARLQARNGSVLASLRHTPIKMEDPAGRGLLQLMDGTRDRAAILNQMTGLIASGEVAVHREGQPMEDAGEAVRFITEHFEESLARMARLALLVA
jgi:methyltransferase-like protein